jgi:2-oxo-4-hydroxy-4-carboxy--5-ureidoimidazoline (OHCU) decarboxylase
MRDLPRQLIAREDSTRIEVPPEAGLTGREASGETADETTKEGARGGTMGSPTLEELGELFEGRTRFVERLAGVPDPLVRALTLVHELPLDEKKEVLDAHPAIGQQTGLSARSAAEQGGDSNPEVLAELTRLNAEYQRRHGFRFVVFVNRRPRAEILEVLKARIGRPTDDELETALDELVAIAEDRWRRR